MWLLGIEHKCRELSPNYLRPAHSMHDRVDKGPMGMYFQWVRRFGTQNGPQKRVQNDREPMGMYFQWIRRFGTRMDLRTGSRTDQNEPQKRVQNGKIDIQSQVLFRPFSVNFQTRNGREIAIRPTKKTDFYRILKLASSAIRF